MLNIGISDLKRKSHCDKLWSVKIYNKTSEFEIDHFTVGAEISVYLPQFYILDSRINTIREDLLRTPELYYLHEQMQEEALKFGFTAKCLLSIIRISGPLWKFPYHCDKIDQLVFHLEGIKRWWWRDDAGIEQSIVARPGDVIFLPAGLYHRTENDNATIICNYGMQPTQTVVFYEKGPSGIGMCPRNVCHNS